MKSISKDSSIMRIIVLIIALVIFSLTSVGGIYAAADEGGIDNTNVLDDLEGAVVEDKVFDLDDYGFNQDEDLRLISFVEYGYSFYLNNRQDYSLYIYLYNPQGLNIDEGSSLNKIRVNDVKYSLQFINKSDKPGYEAMFYKFKIAFTSEQREQVLDLLNNDTRVYAVSEIELCLGGTEAIAFEVANIYTYSGYALGYGHAAATESSLKCISSGLKTLTLDVNGAAYTPEGTSGSNNYTKHMLFSVYFSVPKETVSEYGGISKIYAEWLNAVTKPIFITDSEEVYNAIEGDIGKIIPEHKDYRETQPYGFASDIIKYNTFDADGILSPNGDTINQLYYIFLANDQNSYINDYGQYVLKGDVVLDYIKEYTENHNDSEDDGSGGMVPGGGHGGGGGSGRSITVTSSQLVANKYNANLFSEYDENYTYAEIEADDGYSLTNEKLTQSFWEKLFNVQGTQSAGKEFEEINAIYEVNDSDVTDNIKETCAKLFINESYYDEFKKFYDNATAKDEVVYLFRFYQADYLCDIAEVNKWTGTWLQPELYKEIYGNHYVAQTHVILDFDIIKVRFTKGEVNTEIPVVMSPIDIVPDLEPPPIIIRASDFWKYSLLATVFLVLFFVVYRIINKYLVEAEETMAVTVDVKQKKKRKTKIKE